MTGRTQAECVERWGFNANTLKSNLNGNVDFSFKRAKAYGSAFKVRAEWLYDGSGPMQEPAKTSRRPPIEVPVISWVSAGGLNPMGDIENIADAERLVLSGLPPARYFATQVRGDSMDRVSPEGSRIIVNCDDHEPIAGRFYLFSLRGEATFKRYYDSPIKRLEPFSTNPANRTIYLAEDPDWNVVGRVVRSLLDLG